MTPLQNSCYIACIVQYKASSEQYYSLVKGIYDLIVAEMSRYMDDKENLPIAYPKLVVMTEFMRLLRGEAFIDLRIPPLSEHQKEFYDMERTVFEKLKELQSQLDPNDERTTFHIKEMQKAFDVEK